MTGWRGRVAGVSASMERLPLSHIAQLRYHNCRDHRVCKAWSSHAGNLATLHEIGGEPAAGAAARGCRRAGQRAVDAGGPGGARGMAEGGGGGVQRRPTSRCTIPQYSPASHPPLPLACRLDCVAQWPSSTSKSSLWAMQAVVSGPHLPPTAPAVDSPAAARGPRPAAVRHTHSHTHMSTAAAQACLHLASCWPVPRRGPHAHRHLLPLLPPCSRAAGKSSLLQRLLTGRFQRDLNPTYAPEFGAKKVGSGGGGVCVCVCGEGNSASLPVVPNSAPRLLAAAAAPPPPNRCPSLL